MNIPGCRTGVYSARGPLGQNHHLAMAYQVAHNAEALPSIFQVHPEPSVQWNHNEPCNTVMLRDLLTETQREHFITRVYPKSRPSTHILRLSPR